VEREKKGEVSDSRRWTTRRERDETNMTPGDPDVGELDVTVVNTISSHLLSNISDVDSGEKVEGSEEKRGNDEDQRRVFPSFRPRPRSFVVRSTTRLMS